MIFFYLGGVNKWKWVVIFVKFWSLGGTTIKGRRVKASAVLMLPTGNQTLEAPLLNSAHVMGISKWKANPISIFKSYFIV